MVYCTTDCLILSSSKTKHTLTSHLDNCIVVLLERVIGCWFRTVMYTARSIKPPTHYLFCNVWRYAIMFYLFSQQTETGLPPAPVWQSINDMVLLRNFLCGTTNMLKEPAPVGHECKGFQAWWGWTVAGVLTATRDLLHFWNTSRMFLISEEVFSFFPL